MGSGQKNNGQLTVGSELGHERVGSGQWSVGSGQRIVGSKQWAVSRR